LLETSPDHRLPAANVPPAPCHDSVHTAIVIQHYQIGISPGGEPAFPR
jgi:hypothetical protein